MNGGAAAAAEEELIPIAMVFFVLWFSIGWSSIHNPHDVNAQDRRKQGHEEEEGTTRNETFLVLVRQPLSFKSS